MKKAFIPLLLGLVLAGCSNDDEPKGSNIDGDCFAGLTIEIVDENGNNWYSYDYDGIINPHNLSEEISYSYKEQKNYAITCKYEPRPTNDMGNALELANFRGLFLMRDSYKNPRIKFGYLDGARDIDETFQIHWPDGTTNEIRFTAKGGIDWFDSMKVRLDDGEWMKSTNVTIVK